MNRTDIMEILPHRASMLLVDEAFKTGEHSASGKYTVRGDEWFLDGHFPGNPVVPGVILCEIMAQTCSVILADEVKGATPYFTGLNKVKFRRKVLPGDKLEISCDVTGSKASFYFAKAKAKVCGNLAASAEFSFAIVREEGS